MRIRSLPRRWRAVFPIVLFAAALAVLQLVSSGTVTFLPVQSVFVAVMLTAAFRLVVRPGALPGVAPGTLKWRLFLFALVTWHFVAILASESSRALRAWSLAAPRRRGPLAWRSLSWAVVSVVSRSWAHAERFYQAQRLRGLTA